MPSDNSYLKDTKKAFKWWLGWLLATPFILALVGYLYLKIGGAILDKRPPMASDEKMIAHFQEHRSEFEALVKNYRAFLPTDEQRVFTEIPENKALKESAGVYRIDEYGHTWFPNPYSPDAAREFDRIRKQWKKNELVIHSYEEVRIGLKPQTLGPTDRVEVMFWPGIRWLLGNLINLGGRSVGDYLLIFIVPFYHTVHKDYVYIPEIPKIENDRLWAPVTSTGNSTGSDRVYPSLSPYPLSLMHGECVYRPIEAHWFIKLCIN